MRSWRSEGDGVVVERGAEDVTAICLLGAPEGVEAVRAAQPAVTFHLYPAGHGFNCEQRSDYHAKSAALALRRTLDFLADALG